MYSTGNIVLEKQHNLHLGTPKKTQLCFVWKYQKKSKFIFFLENLQSFSSMPWMQLFLSHPKCFLAIWFHIVLAYQTVGTSIYKSCFLTCMAVCIYSSYIMFITITYIVFQKWHYSILYIMIHQAIEVAGQIGIRKLSKYLFLLNNTNVGSHSRKSAHICGLHRVQRYYITDLESC